MEFLWETEEQWNGRHFCDQRKFGSGIRDGVRRTLVRRVAKKCRIGAKTGIPSKS